MARGSNGNEGEASRLEGFWGLAYSRPPHAHYSPGPAGWAQSSPYSVRMKGGPRCSRSAPRWPRLSRPTRDTLMADPRGGVASCPAHDGVLGSSFTDNTECTAEVVRWGHRSPGLCSVPRDPVHRALFSLPQGNASPLRG